MEFSMECDETSMRPLMQLSKVSKQYSGKIVLESLSFSLYETQALAILGANGSGKSTLLRLIAGISSFTSGDIHLVDQAATIGYVPERFPKLRFTPAEYLNYMGRMQGLSSSYINKRITELLAFCHLEHTGSTRIERFSKGMLQKVGIMQAILTKPDLLVLDEPLSGLDINAQSDLIELMNELKRQGMSIVFSCHESDLLEQVADRIIILEQGVIASDILLVELDQASVIIEVDRLEEAIFKQISELSGVTRYEPLPKRSAVSFKIYVCSNRSDAVLNKILSMGGSIVSLHKADEQLEKVRKAIIQGGRS
jgi:ABC-type multidrug transport system ATPase subunit